MAADAPPRLTMPVEALLARRLELLGLPPLTGVRVTDNRSVMVSLSPRGVLSIHRGYGWASDRVLKAVVRFVAPHVPRARRRAAEREILAFHPEEHAPPLSPGQARRPRAPDRPRAGDAEKIRRLEALFAAFNRDHFDGRLPVLPIRLSGRMRTRLGQLCLRHGSGAPYEITLNRRHVDGHGWAEAADTLLHEMVHLWQHASGHAVDHGRAFRRKAAEIGIAAAARRAVRPGQARRAARLD